MSPTLEYLGGHSKGKDEAVALKEAQAGVCVAVAGERLHQRGQARLQGLLITDTNPLHLVCIWHPE
jgi:hypothetical protein